MGPACRLVRLPCNACPRQDIGGISAKPAGFESSRTTPSRAMRPDASSPGRRSCRTVVSGGTLKCLKGCRSWGRVLPLAPQHRTGALCHERSLNPPRPTTAFHMMRFGRLAARQAISLEVVRLPQNHSASCDSPFASPESLLLPSPVAKLLVSTRVHWGAIQYHHTRFPQVKKLLTCARADVPLP